MSHLKQSNRMMKMAFEKWKQKGWVQLSFKRVEEQYFGQKNWVDVHFEIEQKGLDMIKESLRSSKYNWVWVG